VKIEKQIAPPAPVAAFLSNKLAVNNDQIRDDLTDSDLGRTRSTRNVSGSLVFDERAIFLSRITRAIMDLLLSTTNSIEHMCIALNRLEHQNKRTAIDGNRSHRSVSIEKFVR
jgi:hypothetical protein